MHSGNWKQDARVISHTGDMTHVGITRNASFITDTQRTREEARANAVSGRRAIAAYIPYEKFCEYLDYFVKNAHQPQYEEAFNTALLNLGEQILEAKDSFPDQPSAETIKTAMEEYKGEHPFTMVKGQLLKEDLHSHSELITSLALFQAAHISYLDEFVNALNRDYYRTIQGEEGHLTKEQHQNALATLMGPLRQFNAFLVFREVLPSILYEREKLGVESSELQGVELTRPAINAGWNRFFEAELLGAYDLFKSQENARPHHKADDGTPIMVCPANQHLMKAQQAGSIEAVLDTVTNDPERLSPLVDKVNTTLTEVDEGKREKYKDQAETITKSVINRLQGVQEPSRGSAPGGVTQWVYDNTPRCPIDHAALKGGSGKGRG